MCWKEADQSGSPTVSWYFLGPCVSSCLLVFWFFLHCRLIPRPCTYEAGSCTPALRFICTIIWVTFQIQYRSLCGQTKKREFILSYLEVQV